jgi:hypothetical protein
MTPIFFWPAIPIPPVPKNIICSSPGAVPRKNSDIHYYSILSPFQPYLQKLSATVDVQREYEAGEF